MWKILWVMILNHDIRFKEIFGVNVITNKTSTVKNDSYNKNNTNVKEKLKHDLHTNNSKIIPTLINNDNSFHSTLVTPETPPVKTETFNAFQDPDTSHNPNSQKMALVFATKPKTINTIPNNINHQSQRYQKYYQQHKLQESSENKNLNHQSWKDQFGNNIVVNENWF